MPTPRCRHDGKVLIGLIVLVVGLILVAVLSICCFVKLKRKHTQLSESQRGLLDQVQELSNAVSPRPSRSKRWSLFSWSKRRRSFGSGFFAGPSINSPSSTPFSSCDSPVTQMASPLCVVDVCEGGNSSARAIQAKKPDSTKKTAPQPISECSSYTPPSITVTASNSDDTLTPSDSAASGDNVGPLQHKGLRHVTEFNPKSVSADHATASRRRGMKKQADLEKQVMSSERTGTVSKAASSRGCHRDQIFSHVLGEDRDSVTALRQSHLIMM